MSPPMTDTAELIARLHTAMELLAAEDGRQAKLHDLLETIREQIRLEVAPEHRPVALFTNIQNAVYAMRGRTPLLNDAAIAETLREAVAALSSDRERGVRGPCNLIFGPPAKLDTLDGASEALTMLKSGEMEVSYCRYKPITPAESAQLWPSDA